MNQLFRFCPHCGTALQDAESYGKVRRVCPACAYIHFDDPKVAACTFVRQNGKVLLVKRAVEPEQGKWALPAGYIDYGEDPLDAARRETLEETGLVVEITRLHDVMFYQGHNAVIVIIYEGRPVGGELCPNDDAEAAAWFNADELPDVAFESTRIVLDRWQEQNKP